ncbi:MAG: DNA-binding protein WhiA [Firmicutes bacterium]|nr:DNA-binding protein WhiA [Bacillota bacterium]
MSFSVQVKQEAARVLPASPCCWRAELAALALTAGSLCLGSPENALVITTESPAVARKVFRLSKQLGWDRSVAVRRCSRPRHHHLFVIRLPLRQNGLFILQELGFASRKNRLKEHLDLRLWDRSCCRRAFLRGCFLGSGYFSKPDHSYHLEFLLDTAEGAEEVKRALARFGLTPGQRERKGSFGIYLKEADQVGEFLRIIGATRAVLEFENSRILKEMRNHVNRLVNCETANLAKTVEAGLRQVEMIKQLAAHGGLSSLPPHLRDLAELRLVYPDASFRELGRLLSPPVSKSGVNHRFRELRRIADRVLNQETGPEARLNILKK